MNFDDRMIERDLEEAIGNDGPDPELRQRLLAATGAKGAHDETAAPVVARTPSRARRVTAPIPRRSNAPAWIGAAAALVISMGVLWLAVPPKPDHDASSSATNQPLPVAPGVSKPGASHSGGSAGNDLPADPEPLPGPARNQPTTPTPGTNEPSPPANLPAPHPAPVPQPEPQPTPPAPDEVVETPKPEPKPEGTEAKPEPVPQPAKVAALLLRGERLKTRPSVSSEWADFKGGEIAFGMQLKTAKPAELRLTDGALLRFDGELVLREAAGVTQAELLARRSELYLDNAGCTAVGIVVGSLACTVLGVVYAEHEGATVGLACFEGRVDHGAQQLKAGQQCKLGDKGFGKVAEMRAPRPRLVTEAAPRVLARNDFDAEGGVARTSGDNADITTAIGEMPVLAGATLRLRYRVTGGKALYVQMQKSAGDTQYGKWIPLAKVGDWQELEIPLAELVRDDNKGEGAPVIGEVLRTLRVFAQDGTNPTLEIDWYEISRKANQE